MLQDSFYTILDQETFRGNLRSQLIYWNLIDFGIVNGATATDTFIITAISVTIPVVFRVYINVIFQIIKQNIGLDLISHGSSPHLNLTALVSAAQPTRTYVEYVQDHQPT